MGWLDSVISPIRQKSEEHSFAFEDYITVTPEAQSRIHELDDLTTAQVGLLIACSGASFAIGFKLGRAQSPWSRFTAVTDIPTSYFGPTAPFLRGGRVVSVFLHPPYSIYRAWKR
jgi:hypothetical protein